MSSARNSQNKGKDFQVQVAKALALYTGLEAPGDFTSNHGGKEGEEDVHRSSLAKKVFPFWIETKNSKTLALPAWILKNDEDRSVGKCRDPGAIVYKLSGSSRIRVDLDLEALLKALYGDRGKEQSRAFLAVFSQYHRNRLKKRSFRQKLRRKSK